LVEITEAREMPHEPEKHSPLPRPDFSLHEIWKNKILVEISEVKEMPHGSGNHSPPKARFSPA
jgi:hypothetical protein